MLLSFAACFLDVVCVEDFYKYYKRPRGGVHAYNLYIGLLLLLVLSYDSIFLN